MNNFNTNFLKRYFISCLGYVQKAVKMFGLVQLFTPKHRKVFLLASFAMSRYVVYDCDTGTDDAWGLHMLIKGEEVRNKSQTTVEDYKILGVTCVQGNTNVDNAIKNTLRVLEALDRTDYPKMVDYILVGPLTNFAVCINMYGDEFLNKIRSIYIMGGNIKGKGNITKSAEFNFMLDPEAAYIVLENIQKTPSYILPWETCIDGDFGVTLAWRLEVLGSVDSKIMQLMNRVETAVFIPKGFINWIVCDAMLVAAYIFPKLAIAKSRTYHATVELTGTHTRGQMVLDHTRQKIDNVTVILEIDRNYWRKIIKWTAGVPDSSVEDIC